MHPSQSVFARMQSEHMQACLYICEFAREPYNLKLGDYTVWDANYPYYVIDIHFETVLYHT